ncbi:hypothetical protein [Bradyrhizobium sp. CCGUVB23]|uniref:hypothetical protein n=1 Tax=Bradyrhizobium sp. CCGUVB23 TaxID=2949630 RepID=UPI0020B2B6A1|nr:hypothetical protein [Bradyrhizobium sp. CCGUVB23]MCP3463129.1 hypothetical protein [Bradyrhizobium sp. CCGUVB23]
MKESKTQLELIGCYDCGTPVAFSAVACPTCGSSEPLGPYVHSPRELKLHRIEEKNDQTLMSMTLLCCGIGLFLGALIGGIWAAFGYGLVGAIIGVPAGFIINVSRRIFG